MSTHLLIRAIHHGIFFIFEVNTNFQGLIQVTNTEALASEQATAKGSQQYGASNFNIDRSEASSCPLFAQAYMNN